MKFNHADMNELERAIYASAFVHRFFNDHQRENDDARARLAEDDAQALISVRRRLATGEGSL